MPVLELDLYRFLLKIWRFFITFFVKAIFNRTVHIGTTEDITDSITELDKVDIAEGEVIGQFGLELKVGRFVDDSFNEIKSNTYIEIGEHVQVHLETIATEDFR